MKAIFTKNSDTCFFFKCTRFEELQNSKEHNSNSIISKVQDFANAGEDNAKILLEQKSNENITLSEELKVMKLR